SESAGVLQRCAPRRAREATPHGRRPDRALRGESADSILALGSALRHHCGRSTSEAAGGHALRGPRGSLGRRSQPRLATTRRCLPVRSGFFAQSFARKLIDIDYHIAMGCRAYAALADALSRGKGRVLGQVFAELSTNFQPMVDVLNEVSETSYTHSDKDILRLYEVWLKTGSKRCYEILKRLGVEPTSAGGTTFAN